MPGLLLQGYVAKRFAEHNCNVEGPQACYFIHGWRNHWGKMPSLGLFLGNAQCFVVASLSVGVVEPFELISQSVGLR